MALRPPEIPIELPEPQTRRGTSYFAAWAIMACVGALYLAAVSIRPAFLDGLLPAAESEVASQTAADIVNIRDFVGQLQTDMAQVQKDTSQQADAMRGMSDRIAALEQKVNPADATAHPAATEPQRMGAVDSGSDSAEFPSGQADLPSATRQPKVLNSPIETGSVHTDPASEAAPTPRKLAADKAAAAPAKPKKPVGIRLATGASVDNLRVSWGILSERHSAELKPLQPRYSNSVDGNGIVYELVAGPFKTTADAKKVCDSLKAQAIDCQVSGFGGNAL